MSNHMNGSFAQEMKTSMTRKDPGLWDPGPNIVATWEIVEFSCKEDCLSFCVARIFNPRFPGRKHGLETRATKKFPFPVLDIQPPASTI